MVVMMLGMGFGNAAATLVGQNIGASRMDRGERAAWLTVGMYGLIAVPLTIVFLVFAEQIVAIFNSQPEVVDNAANFVRWFSATFVFMCLSMVLGRAMNGAGDTFWPMVITGVGMVALRIPAAYGLAYFLKSVTGVWVGLAVSNVVQGLLFAAAFRRGHWKVVGRSHVEAARVHAVAAGQAVPGDTQAAVNRE
jgi:Na+-driven multidrug efflux pump